MNGHLLARTPIAVDYWRPTCEASVFFLSHIHADHTQGLNKKWNKRIYCTAITGRLVCDMLSVAPHLILPLELNETHMIPLDDSGDETCSVSVIDANHCPGACMFLFEGYFGQILYTGDFRYCKEMFVETPLCRNLSIDVLYLDNTYCQAEYTFPTRDEAAQVVMDIIRQYPGHDIVIGTSTLSKLDLIVEIGKQMEEWISVDLKMFFQLSLVGNMPNVFTTNQSRIRVVKRDLVRKNAVEEWNNITPTIAILPTALFSGPCYTNKNCDTDLKLFPVPYSDHSNYPELTEFVKRVRPKAIIPIVCKRSKTLDKEPLEDMTCFDCYLDPAPIIHFEVPDSVKVRLLKQMNSSVVAKGTEKRKRSFGKMSVNKIRRIAESKMGIQFVDCATTAITTAGLNEDDLTSQSDNDEVEITDSMTSHSDVHNDNITSQVVELLDNMTSQLDVGNDKLPSQPMEHIDNMKSQSNVHNDNMTLELVVHKDNTESQSEVHNGNMTSQDVEFIDNMTSKSDNIVSQLVVHVPNENLVEISKSDVHNDNMTSHAVGHIDNMTSQLDVFNDNMTSQAEHIDNVPSQSDVYKKTSQPVEPIDKTTSRPDVHNENMTSQDVEIIDNMTSQSNVHNDKLDNMTSQSGVHNDTMTSYSHGDVHIDNMVSQSNKHSCIVLDDCNDKHTENSLVDQQTDIGLNSSTICKTSSVEGPCTCTSINIIPIGWKNPVKFPYNIISFKRIPLSRGSSDTGDTNKRMIQEHSGPRVVIPDKRIMQDFGDTGDVIPDTITIQDASDTGVTHNSSDIGDVIYKIQDSSDIGGVITEKRMIQDNDTR